MIVPDVIVEVAGTAWAGLQAWQLAKLSSMDKKLAVIGTRLEAVEKNKK